MMFLGLLFVVILIPSVVPAQSATTVCQQRWGNNQAMVEHCERMAAAAQTGTVLSFDFGVRAVESCITAGDVVEYRHAGQTYRTALAAVKIEGPCPEGMLSAVPAPAPVTGQADPGTPSPENVSGAPAASASSAPTSSGTVNVRGYTRKDGTYVAPYTRSAPRRR